MLWIKAFHLIFMVTWFAGLFYLPRLFVYHSMAEDQLSLDRFKVMERKLFMMATLGGTLTLIFGLWLLALNFSFYIVQGWIQVKLVLILVLVAYHVYCGHLVNVFKNDENARGHVFYRWFNEFPVLILLPVIFLAVLRPF